MLSEQDVLSQGQPVLGRANALDQESGDPQVAECTAEACWAHGSQRTQDPGPAQPQLLPYCVPTPGAQEEPGRDSGGGASLFKSETACRPLSLWLRPLPVCHAHCSRHETMKENNPTCSALCSGAQVSSGSCLGCYGTVKSTSLLPHRSGASPRPTAALQPHVRAVSHGMLLLLPPQTPRAPA